MLKPSTLSFLIEYTLLFGNIFNRPLISNAFIPLIGFPKKKVCVNPFGLPKVPNANKFILT